MHVTQITLNDDDVKIIQTLLNIGRVFTYPVMKMTDEEARSHHALLYDMGPEKVKRACDIIWKAAEEIE